MYDNFKTRKRWRSLGDIPIYGRERRPSGFVDISTRLRQTEFTQSEGHPWNHRVPGDLNDIGGAFFNSKVTVDGGNYQRRYSTSPGEQYGYDGCLVPTQALDLSENLRTESIAGTIPKYLSDAGAISSTSQLNALGATAIARCSPTKQYASVMNTLKELYTEGLPKVPGVSQARIQKSLRDFETKKKQGLIKGSADEYLNVVFGWSPLLGDVQSIYSSVKNWDKIVGQFRRDAGRVVRRGYQFPPLVREVQIQQGTLANASTAWPANLPTIDYSAWRPTDYYRARSSRSSQWFSGAFTYYIPDGDDFVSKMRRKSQELDQLLGVGLTPETIWNGTPWSWLVDWFSNAGDVITNVSNMLDDGLVMHYGYMMEKSTIQYSCLAKGTALRGTTPGAAYTADLRIEVKQRVRASPFGFGVNFASLSTKQRLILAALGITRV